MNYAPWANVVCGLLVFSLRYAAPRGTFAVHWNLFLTGIVIMFVALAAAIAHGNTSRNYWSAINFGTAAWLFISSRTIPSTAFVNSAMDILGIVVFVLAFASLASEIAEHRRT